MEIYDDMSDSDQDFRCYEWPAPAPDSDDSDIDESFEISDSSDEEPIVHDKMFNKRRRIIDSLYYAHLFKPRPNTPYFARYLCHKKMPEPIAKHIHQYLTYEVFIELREKTKHIYDCLTSTIHFWQTSKLHKLSKDWALIHRIPISVYLQDSTKVICHQKRPLKPWRIVSTVVQGRYCKEYKWSSFLILTPTIPL
jgi:hypothetical protein